MTFRSIRARSHRAGRRRPYGGDTPDLRQPDALRQFSQVRRNLYAPLSGGATDRGAAADACVPQAGQAGVVGHRTGGRRRAAGLHRAADDADGVDAERGSGFAGGFRRDEPAEPVRLGL